MPLLHVWWAPFSRLFFFSRITQLPSQGLLKTLIQSPYDALAANTWMNLEAAGLRLAASIGLATVLGDSEDGFSIAEIAEKTAVDGSKLGM